VEINAKFRERIMANAEILNQSDCFVWFTLSNKPEFVCVLDKEDFFKIVHNSTCWYIHISSGRNTKRAHRKSHPYIRMSSGIKGRHVHLHRFIMNAGDYSVNNIIDHINHDSLDNRKSNLRQVTIVENAKNREDYRNGFYVTAVQRNGKIVRHQAYHYKTYLGSSKDLDIIKARVHEYAISKGLKYEEQN
jgi:hypothetical protein